MDLRTPIVTITRIGSYDVPRKPVRVGVGTAAVGALAHGVRFERHPYCVI
jgi:hypothetical protein